MKFKIAGIKIVLEAALQRRKGGTLEGDTLAETSRAPHVNCHKFLRKSSHEVAYFVNLCLEITTMLGFCVNIYNKKEKI